MLVMARSEALTMSRSIPTPKIVGPSGSPDFDIGRCLCIGTRTERVLVIGAHGDIGDPGARIYEPVERAAAMAFDDALVAAIHDRRTDRAPVSIGKSAVFDEIDLALAAISLAKHGCGNSISTILTTARGNYLAWQKFFHAAR